VNRQKKHQTQDIFFITLCAVICGADNWVDIEEFGLAKQDGFTEQLGFINGIPPHDTFGAVFAVIDHDQFSARFSAWVADLSNITEGEVFANGETGQLELSRQIAERDFFKKMQ
jgi:hypothetical protein